ncbi:glutamine-hydrolyzing carbamoyl-phosphate synthase small subunit [Methermicoccus shengliensis]|uniref:Carbamoyl phosphate synthase small chain n=1 Tax=Methermicoccus shengliensis TaxID=660064 RepID=A0A832RYR8_9EURY|nr:glutamine-hydrolyzing carbamoyl-phosphate synthase small subunit [Methermicoccus shengliensis]KUK04090.1 MAG: Carbamoyl-phosphate synthase small chain [Euryarchaeota archaeon 55_53]KUK29852.1 MAG: Carbamoyl-phosphate synthase small chain [Methanosarcinales archeaon 56_1174]HIH69816.1 glutamine-hydrolyzing carbamoyl-phosphate synthase small subunit [Methermicoccus shengliensis]
MEAVLGIEDGTVVHASSAGAEGVVCGELVFTTQYTGYEEALTDPSYRGQVLMFTYPLIGNYGVSRRRFQSEHVQVEAMVVHELCTTPSHYQSRMSLGELFEQEGKIALYGVDTRALTIKLRSRGTLRCCILAGSSDGERAVELARAHPDISDIDLVPKVTCSEPYRIEGKGPKFAVLDLGIKQSMLDNLVKRGCCVDVFPYGTRADEIMAHKPDALLVSNGPGDPARAVHAIEVVRELAGTLPIYGICFGHQIISLALGARTYKLKFGHRGANQPVKDVRTGSVYITSQNHGFAVDAHSAEDTELAITHINLNDDTVEGVESRYLQIRGVQFHPEACPGPYDTEGAFFDEVVKEVAR